MRFLYLPIWLLCYLLISCENNDSHSAFVNPSLSKPFDSSLLLTMKKFGLTDTGLLQKNTILFYSSRSFDTSFFLKLEYNQEEITGVYYEVLPTYHNNINSYADSNHDLMFFEGYSFKLDSVYWAKIVNQANRILDTVDTSKDNNGCRDCVVYGLFYDSTFKGSSIENASIFEYFYFFLKKLFLSDFILKRKPIMHKTSGNLKDYF